jgi:hypothetical protein
MYTQLHKRGVPDVSLRAGACVTVTSACFFKDAYRPCSETLYWTLYRSQRTYLELDVQKRRQNVASVANFPSLGIPSKPVRRRDPALGRFDSCAAPFGA